MIFAVKGPLWQLTFQRKAGKGECCLWENKEVLFSGYYKYLGVFLSVRFGYISSSSSSGKFMCSTFFRGEVFF